MVSRDEILELDSKRTEIENEIIKLTSDLNSTEMGCVGLTKSLIDKEGFPRSDIDIYAIRNARHRIACLKTDLKAINAEIEEKLIELHSSNKKATN